MSEIIRALDNFTPKQVGENGNVEHAWSNSIKEKIMQFSFQLVRTKDYAKLENVLRDLLQNISLNKEERIQQLHYLTMLYKMIGHTRDIVDGKGEYALTYMMIYIWHEFYPVLAKFALESLFYTDEQMEHPYGSLKDIKHFANYCYTRDTNHPLISAAISILTAQLKTDEDQFVRGLNKLSLAAKWAPREKSRYKWLFHLLAQDYYPHYLETAKSAEQLEKAKLKCYTDYRKMLSMLNIKLDTLQIKQCANTWSDINFNHVTSISFSKQKKAFLNKTKKDEPRFPDRQDRVQCAENFTSFVTTSIKEGKEIKGKRVGMESFTRQAVELLSLSPHSADTQLQIQLLNSQWRDNSVQTGCLGNMVSMVDVSGSMEGDPMDVAIAMGIRVADKSVLGKRVMTFSSNPKWVNLDNCDGFVSQVEVIKRAEWGMGTNFRLALKMILDAIVENKMDPKDVQNMILVIFSDMQIDAADSQSSETMFETITNMYKEAGLRTHGTPYKPPHLLFWNLRSTSGFPSLSSQHNTTMLSGFSPSLLNLFCEQGMEALESISPWSQLETLLENARYDMLKTALVEYFFKI